MTAPVVGQADPQFDSARITVQNSYSIMSMVQIGMIGLNTASLAPIPEAITRLPSTSNGDISPDGLTYTFHIRPHLAFSNGDPINARTFAFSLERSMSWEVGMSAGTAPFFLGELKGANAYIQANYANGSAHPPVPSIAPTDPTNGIEGAGRAIFVQDNLTLVLTLQSAEASSLFFNQLTYPVSWAVDPADAPADPFGSNFNAGWAAANPSAIPASGPFMIQSFTHAQNIVQVPNPHWFGPALTLTQVTIPFAPDAATAFGGYQAGQDDVSPVGIGDIPAAQALPNAQFHRADLLEILYLAMNWLDPFLGDQLVRQAFAETIDRAAIARSVRGDSVRPSEHLVPAGMPGCNPNLTGFGFNPVDAKAKLLQAEMQHNVQPPAQIVFEYNQGGGVTRNTEVAVMINDWNL